MLFSQGDWMKHSNLSLVESGAVMISNWEYSAFPVDVISIKQ